MSELCELLLQEIQDFRCSRQISGLPQHFQLQGGFVGPNGRKIADGTLAEITQKFSEQPGDANLEEIFFRATSETSVGAPMAPPPLPH